MQTPTTPAIYPYYSVRVKNYPGDLQTPDRIKIEASYARELERIFGGPEQVAAAIDTLEALEESPPAVLSAGDQTLVKAWGKASAAARQVALREVRDADGCYFDVDRVPF